MYLLSAGVYLLSLWNMIYGVGYIKTEQWRIPFLIQDLQEARAKVYAYTCAEHGGRRSSVESIDMT